MSAAGLVVALISLCVTLLGALVTVVWRTAGLTSTMQAMITELRKTVEELREDLKQLKVIPLLEQRIATLEKLHDSLSHKVSSLWQKTFSLDRHVAVVQERQRPGSSPDLSHLLPREEP